MNTKLISTFMLCLVFLALDVRISFASQIANYLLITENNIRITSGAVCDYRIQEGTFPTNIIGLLENNYPFPGIGDYFGREQVIDRQHWNSI